MDNRVSHSPAPEAPSMNLARVQALPWLLFIAMLAIAAWLGMKAFGSDERGDPVAGALLAFEKQNSLTVFSARFDVLASSTDERGVLGVDLLKSEQAVAVPAMVEYRLDLSGVGRERMTWDAENQVLSSAPAAAARIEAQHRRGQGAASSPRACGSPPRRRTT